MPKDYEKKSSYKKRDNDDYDSKYNQEMEDAMDDGNGRRGRKFSGGNKKKSCRFMAGEEDTANITYKNPKFLSTFMTEHGKIVARRVTGNCSMVQHRLATEIKRARNLALLGHISIGPNSN